MFIYTTNGKEIKQENMPAKTYALAGFQNKKDKGLLTVRTIEGLVPLLNENGYQYRFEKMAGKTFDGNIWRS